MTRDRWIFPVFGSGSDNICVYAFGLITVTKVVVVVRKMEMKEQKAKKKLFFDFQMTLLYVVRATKNSFFLDQKSDPTIQQQSSNHCNGTENHFGLSLFVCEFYITLNFLGCKKKFVKVDCK